MSKFDRLSVYAVLLASGLALFACRGRQTKDKYTDTATSGFISISADESFRRIVQQEIDVFESIYTMAGIDPIYASEVDAINLLLKDSVRLIVSTRRLTDAEKAGLEEKKFFPKEFKVASDAIALIVNRQNPDSIISLKDLSRILTGEVTEWSELYPGSKLGKLQLVFDNPNSSTVRYAIDSICRGRPLAGSLHAQKSNAEVIDFVSQSPSAIGVIGVSWVGSESDSTNLSFSDRVTVMAVSREEKATEQNSYKPFQAYMALGDYPLMRDVYVILTDPRSGLASGFSTFLASDRGQRIILRAGLMPATQNVRIVNVRDNL